MQEITFAEAQLVERTNTIREAWASLLRDPGLFVRHWNYKGAVLSGGLRASVFLITYLISRESLRLAIGAAVVQFIFRFLFAGLSGAMIQSFRRVEPAWKAMVSILVVIPLISHVLEYLVQVGFVHYTATTDHTDMAIVRSVCVSIFSVLFALYIMRRNVMIVGEAESKSLWSDIVHLPYLIYEFMAFIPREIASLLRRGAYAGALLAIAAFGVFSQMICWAVTNKLFWTYGGGKQIAGLRFWAVDGMILMVVAVIVSSIPWPRKLR
jgi:energy-converting hydrogenase Eha subunit C